MDRVTRERRPRRTGSARALVVGCSLIAAATLAGAARAETLQYEFEQCHSTSSQVPVESFTGVKQRSGAASVRLADGRVWIFTSAGSNATGGYSFVTPGFETPDDPGSNNIPTITCVLDSPLTPDPDPGLVTGFFKTPNPKG